ncbi:hypothetical protein [Actinomadura atramentaria]|uniref:hypothetical protein n=1 Tax=Actinomadura atramentaria TaxID=1990 RepID=UPI000376A327|nr:hypothetical protein [Actinomadura atramentaria]
MCPTCTKLRAVLEEILWPPGSFEPLSVRQAKHRAQEAEAKLARLQTAGRHRRTEINEDYVPQGVPVGGPIEPVVPVESPAAAEYSEAFAVPPNTPEWEREDNEEYRGNDCAYTGCDCC